MILDDLDDLEGFSLMKNFLTEQFKGGGGGGGGGGGRGSSSRNRKKGEKNPFFPILIFFIVIYTFTFIYFNSLGSSRKTK